MEISIIENYKRIDGVFAETYEEAKEKAETDEYDISTLLHKKDWASTRIYLVDKKSKDSPVTLLCEMIVEEEPFDYDYYTKCEQSFAMHYTIKKKDAENAAEFALEKYKQGEILNKKYLDYQIDTLCSSLDKPYILFQYYKN